MLLVDKLLCFASYGEIIIVRNASYRNTLPRHRPIRRFRRTTEYGLAVVVTKPNRPNRCDFIAYGLWPKIVRMYSYESHRRCIKTTGSAASCEHLCVCRDCLNYSMLWISCEEGDTRLRRMYGNDVKFSFSREYETILNRYFLFTVRFGNLFGYLRILRSPPI